MTIEKITKELKRRLPYAPDDYIEEMAVAALAEYELESTCKTCGMGFVIKPMHDWMRENSDVSIPIIKRTWRRPIERPEVKIDEVCD